MTVAVLLPNLSNARELSLNFEDGRVLNRQVFIDEMSARDHLRFYIDGYQSHDKPRVTFVKLSDSLEVSVSFPSFQRDKKNRNASFAVLFQINDQVTEALKKMRSNFGEFQDDFNNAIIFFNANREILRQNVLESAKEYEYGELPDFRTPLEPSSKKKALIISTFAALLIIIATILMNLKNT